MVATWSDLSRHEMKKRVKITKGEVKYD